MTLCLLPKSAVLGLAMWAVWWPPSYWSCNQSLPDLNFLAVSEVLQLCLLNTQLKCNLKQRIIQCNLQPLQRKIRIPSWPLFTNLDWEHIIVFCRFFSKPFFATHKHWNRAVYFDMFFVYCQRILKVQFYIRPHLCINCSLRFKSARVYTVLDITLKIK